MRCKLSIITINRNNASGLEKTCLSVITQTFKDFEWIIIDGASEDNSVEIIKKYADKINYWISEPDTGVYNAMNKGIQRTDSEYLLFLNSGDYLLYPWTLQEVFDEINISKYADVYFSDAVLSTHVLNRFPREITLDFFIKRMLNHQNCLIRQGLFKHQLYNENYKIIADWYFFIEKIINNNIIFFHIKTHIAVYDPNGMSSNIPKKLKKEIHIQKKEVLRKFNIVEKRKAVSLFWRILKTMKYILPYGLYRLIRSSRDYLRNEERT